MLPALVGLVSRLWTLYREMKPMMDAVFTRAEGGIRQLKQVDTTSMLKKPVMPQLSFAITGDKATVEWLERIHGDCGKVMIPLLKSHASALAYDMIRITPPLAHGAGGTNASGEAGKSVVASELRGLFKPINRLLFGNLVMARDWASCSMYGWQPTSKGMRKDVMKENWGSVYRRFERKGWTASNDKVIDHPNEVYHKQARMGNGKINPNKTFYVRQKNAISSYISVVQRDVGRMTSGWWECARQLGEPADSKFTPPPYVQKSLGHGNVSIKKLGKASSVTITNAVGDTNGVLSKGGMFDNLLAKRGLRLNKDLVKEIEKITKIQPRK